MLVRLAGDYHGRLGILQHARDALGGVGGVDGHIGGAGLHDSEHAHDQLQRSLQAQAHSTALEHAFGAEPFGHPVEA